LNNKVILLFFYFTVLFSQNTTEYLWPANAEKALTTIFGEERSRRFHAGIDVRTFGEIGKAIYAIDSGYITRIKITPDGYGKTLYFKIKDGNTIVYAHLDSFHESIEEKVLKVRKEKKTNFIDEYLYTKELEFKKGDIIGYSGDTGSISGPHLHFEIRDQNGLPINPLKKHYSIEDTLKPIAKSIAFIPLDNSCYINGIQDYTLIDLIKTNDYKYVIHDTLSIVGNFGVALEVEDKINNQPFDFNIYEIELLIDNKLVYKINFDEYNFSNDHLIYKELDFNLLNNLSKDYHRLFINNNKELDFIDNLSNSGLNIDSNYHYLIINISDVSKNKIQIQGIIKGDILVPPNLLFDENNTTITSETGFKNLEINYTTRYENSRLIPSSFIQIDPNTILIDMPEAPYNSIEYFSKNNDGLKSNKKYLSLKKYDPYKIKGDVNIKFFDNGAIIEFIEDVFTGFNAIAILSTAKKETEYNLSRNKKNILASRIINYDEFENIENIKIGYDTKPEIIISKSIRGALFKKDKPQTLSYNDYHIKSIENSIYNNIFIMIEDTLIDIDPEFEIIKKPIKIIPKNISFKDYVELTYLKGSNKGAIFNYSEKKQKWFLMEKYNIESINTKIYSGGIFAILNENVKPEIKNKVPGNKATYKSNDLNEILFNVVDKHSGINHSSIIVKIDNQTYFYDYIPYRNLVRCRLNQKLSPGVHTLEIYIQDKLNNSIYEKSIFHVEK